MNYGTIVVLITYMVYVPFLPKKTWNRVQLCVCDLLFNDLSFFTCYSSSTILSRSVRAL